MNLSYPTYMKHKTTVMKHKNTVCLGAKILGTLAILQTAALAVGSDDRHRAALVALEAGEDPAAERLSDWSREVVESRGAGEALSEAAQGLQ